MKRVLLLIAFIAGINSGYCQQNKEQLFIKTVNEVITAFSKQDSVAANKLIQPKTGLYHIHTMGVYDVIAHVNTIPFFSNGYLDVLFSLADSIVSAPIQFTSSLPGFDCGTEKWSNTGVYTNRKIYHPLSNIIKYLKKIENPYYRFGDMQACLRLEKISRKIIAVDKKGRSLVFYLSYINQKWWLTIIDNAMADCSA